MLTSVSFRPFLPSYHYMLGAYESGSAEVRAAITALSFGSRLHGVYGPNNCRTCVLVLFVWTYGACMGNTYIGNIVWEVLYGL